jgi:predicted Zn-dependent protease
MRRIRAANLIIAMALAAMAGCAAKHRPVVLEPAGHAEALALEHLVALDRAIAPQVEQALGGPLQNLPVRAYVCTVGQRAVRATSLAVMPCQFMILADEKPGLTILPGGTTFVTAGLLRRLTNEAQLAGLLAHGVAHLTAGHVVAGLRERLGPDAVEAATQAALRSASARSPEENEALARVARAAAGMAFTAALEAEADRRGLDYMAAAGYNPPDMVLLVRVLETAGDDTPLGRAHAGPPDRAAAVGAIVAEKYSTRGGRVADAEYRREVLDRLDRP